MYIYIDAVFFAPQFWVDITTSVSRQLCTHLPLCPKRKCFLLFILTKDIDSQIENWSFFTTPFLVYAEKFKPINCVVINDKHIFHIKLTVLSEKPLFLLTAEEAGF